MAIKVTDIDLNEVRCESPSHMVRLIQQASTCAFWDSNSVWVKDGEVYYQAQEDQGPSILPKEAFFTMVEDSKNPITLL